MEVLHKPRHLEFLLLDIKFFMGRIKWQGIITK